MVQRYRFNYVQEMFETETGEQYNETERGEWVKYWDYAALENAVNALLADVKARYPNQDLYCPLMRELERLTK